MMREWVVHHWISELMKIPEKQKLLEVTATIAGSDEVAKGDDVSCTLGYSVITLENYY